MRHGSESPEFRENVTRMPGPQELTPRLLAQAYQDLKLRLAPAFGFETPVPTWMDLGLPRRAFEEGIAEALLVGPIAEHVRARSALADGPARLSAPVNGVCREFLDVDVRDAVMARVAADTRVSGEELNFNAALRLVLLQLEAADGLARVAAAAADELLSGGDAGA